MMTKENLSAILEKPAGAMRLVSMKEACRYGRFGIDKCYELIAQEKITAYKDGHRNLVDLNSIDAYHKTLPRVTVASRANRRRRR
jgi:excisionase family DNA binding protein